MYRWNASNKLAVFMAEFAFMLFSVVTGLEIGKFSIPSVVLWVLSILSVCLCLFASGLLIGANGLSGYSSME